MCDFFLNFFGPLLGDHWYVTTFLPKLMYITVGVVSTIENSKRSAKTNQTSLIGLVLNPAIVFWYILCIDDY